MAEQVFCAYRQILSPGLTDPRVILSNMHILLFILVLAFGLTIGSFLGALTYRVPREISILKGRSFCPSCKHVIAWYDNIPILSYFMLRGKCRNCHKKISIREPFIEISTGILFTLVFYIKILPDANILTGVYYLLITATMIAIFVTDFESQLIPDVFSLFLVSIAFVFLILQNNQSVFELIFTGFSASLFLLFLNIITKGKGMGLGDVKLALFGGMFFGFPKVVSWLFLSFVIGAFAGVMLVILEKAHFGKKIAFAPFLVFSFFLTFFWGDAITGILLPYLN
jgi:prepilin signal peptidase PulO-like enzyme (type II secretory pathway)